MVGCCCTIAIKRVFGVIEWMYMRRGMACFASEVLLWQGVGGVMLCQTITVGWEMDGVML